MRWRIGHRKRTKWSCDFFNAKGAKVAKKSLHLCAFALKTELAEEWHADFL